MNLTSTILDATDNDAGANWCEATSSIDAANKNSDLGTPGRGQRQLHPVASPLARRTV